MYGLDILYSISKGAFGISKQNILPIHWKIWFLHNVENLRALRFKSLHTFMKLSPPHPQGPLSLAWIIDFNHSMDKQSHVK